MESLQDKVRRLEAENVHLKESQSKAQTWDDLYNVVVKSPTESGKGFNMKNSKENQTSIFRQYIVL